MRRQIGFLARHFLSKGGRDFVSGHLANWEEYRRTNGNEDRFYFNQLTIRISRLKSAQRLAEFSEIDGAGTKRDGSYAMALLAVTDKIPSSQERRFLRGGDIFDVIIATFVGLNLKSSISDFTSLNGAFVFKEDMSMVKELFVYGRLDGSDYPHEIIRYLIDSSGEYKLHLGFHARCFWMRGSPLRW